MLCRCHLQGYLVAGLSLTQSPVKKVAVTGVECSSARQEIKLSCCPSCWFPSGIWIWDDSLFCLHPNHLDTAPQQDQGLAYLLKLFSFQQNTHSLCQTFEVWIYPPVQNKMCFFFRPPSSLIILYKLGNLPHWRLGASSGCSVWFLAVRALSSECQGLGWRPSFKMKCPTA